MLNGVLKLAALNPERVRAVAELVPLLEESKHEPEERKRRKRPCKEVPELVGRQF